MSRLIPRSFWLIVQGEPARMQALTTDLDSGVAALPVFSFEDEARIFLDLGALGEGWRVRETMAGELTSVLFGPCAGVGRVVLDPLPSPFAKALMGLVSMRREAFMETYLSTETSRPLATTPDHRRQRADMAAQKVTLTGGG